MARKVWKEDFDTPWTQGKKPLDVFPNYHATEKFEVFPGGHAFATMSDGANEPDDSMHGLSGLSGLTWIAGAAAIRSDLGIG